MKTFSWKYFSEHNWRHEKVNICTCRYFLVKHRFTLHSFIVWQPCFTSDICNTHTWKLYPNREIHPLDPQPNRHSMLVPRVCAPRVTRWSLGRYWSRDLCSKQAAERLTGWLGIQTVILSRSDRSPRQRNLMMHAQCPLPVYCSQIQTHLDQVWLPVYETCLRKHNFNIILTLILGLFN